MSNALVSKQLSAPILPDNQMVQLNAIVSRSDSLAPNVIEGSTEPSSGHPATPQEPLSSLQGHFMSSYPMFIPPMEVERLMSCNLNEQSEIMLNSVDVQQFAIPGRKMGHTPGGQPNSGQPRLSMPNKRKMMAEPTQVHQAPQKMSAAKRRVIQIESAPNKKSAQISAKSTASGKKVVHVEAGSKKSAQPQVSPKSQTESNSSVRAKLRDSLASALALVFQKQEVPLDGKMDGEAVTTIQGGVDGNKLLVSASNSSAATLEPNNAEGSHASRILLPTDVSSDDKQSATLSKEVSGEASQTESFLRTDYQSNTVLPGEESMFCSGFYFKDDLLQGNGLSWASGINSHIPEFKEPKFVMQHEPMHEDLTSVEVGNKVQSPESLAFEIELELFKLFGGVNKKYKEKGRSLLFNLKDRSNPELREQVMSGDIPPDRLCSMTAEELASKELSQWRIAKAEELDHMKVLPDEVNVRRLVKKTHKGEYQVDLDPDYGVLEDNSAGVSVPPPSRSKAHKSEGAAFKANPTKVDQCEITIPNDGDDMQGLMVDDVKDLPPAISLDEFMESLNKEPPFENLPADSATTKPEPDQKNVEVRSKSRSPVESAMQRAQIMSKEKSEVNVESPTIEVDEKSTASPKELKPKAAVQLHKAETVWEGEVQLNLSSMANFVALYKSGDKASTREWPSFFEIKGRVRLEAFDKFLQALPMSRSRAVMVCHFALQEGFADSEHASLLELVDSYIADERLGFAEPAHGVELYLCPPRTKTVDMLVDRLPKSYTDKLNDIDDGLIGIVVWRKVQITSSMMSPISSSQQKNITDKQSRPVQNDVNKNSVFTSRPVPPPSTLSNSQPVDDEDDEPPPGFGPPASRVDDDLPEFTFSGGSRPPATPFAGNLVLAQEIGFQHHPRVPSQQVEQMRELIQKYGQSGSGTSTGIPIEPWNDDDDDDIPEWQPQAPHHSLTPPTQQHVHNSVVPIHVTNHQAHTANHMTFQQSQWATVPQPLQPPMSVAQQRVWDPYGANAVPSRQLYGAPGPVSGDVVRDRRSHGHRKRNR